MLNQTPEESLVDQRGRPYFLWDTDMTLQEFRKGLRDPDLQVRGYLLGKLMRQARPDDVFLFATAGEIRRLWQYVEKHLGDKAEFWTWLFERWERDGCAWR